MIKIIVKDFQSLKEVKLAVDGFTLLVGQTGEGKSASFRALRAAVENKFSKGQVRYGERAATVAMQVDGHTVIATKPENGSPSMTLDGQVFSKLNRTVPEPIANALNMAPLSADGSYSLNMYPQFEPPLLVGFSQKKVLELLSASEALDDLNTVKGELSVKRSETNGAFKSIDSILSSLKVQSSSLSEQVSLMKPIIEDINAKWSELQGVIETAKLVNELIDLSTETERMSSLASSYDSWCTSMSSVVENYTSLSSTLHGVTELSRMLESHNTDVARKSRIIEEGIALKAVVTNRDAAASIRKSLSDVTNLFEMLSIRDEYSSRFDELSLVADGKVCPCCGRPLSECAEVEHTPVQGELF